MYNVRCMLSNQQDCVNAFLISTFLYWCKAYRGRIRFFQGKFVLSGYRVEKDVLVSEVH